MSITNNLGQTKVGVRNTQPQAVSLLLDTYSGAAAAYSLRKLRTAYSGYAIRVRRSSDNTSQDIGFDANGNLDTTSMLSFVGAGNGFVSIWYDQSGNGKNASQVNSANQPQIVTLGVLNIINNKPSILFTGGNKYFTTTTNVLSTGNNPYSIYGVAYNTGVSSSTLFYIGSPSGNNGVGLQIVANGGFRHYWYNAEFVGFNNFVNAQKYYSIEYDGVYPYSSNNGQTVKFGANSKNTLSPILNIGMMPSWGQYYYGNQQELLIFDKYNITSTSIGIRSNLNSYYSIY